MTYLKKISFYIILILFIWFPFQDLIISFIYRNFPTPDLKYLLISKELLIIVILLILSVKFVLEIRCGIRRISFIEIFSLIYIVICLFYLFYFHNIDIPFLTKLTSFRAAIIPILFVLVGKWINLSHDEILFLFKIILIVSSIAILIGFIEINISTDKFWNGFLNLNGYLTKIKGLQEGTAGGLREGVPGNFWGAINDRRMAGSFGSPLALGYFLIVPILFLIFKTINKFWEFIILFFLLAGLIFTETRAAIFSVILGFIYYFFNNLKSLKSPAVKRKIIFFIASFAMLFLIFISLNKILNVSTAVSTLPTDSTPTTGSFSGRNIGHLEAVLLGLSNLKNSIFVGNGFGTAGAWAGLQTTKSIGAGESTYLVLIYQIGGLGFLIYLAWWIFIFYYLYVNYKNSIKDIGGLTYLFKLFICLNFIYFFTGLISEQILTFTSVAHFWILNGSLTNFYNTKKIY